MCKTSVTNLQYRQILRQLHPLLHPKQTKGQQQMFANARDAYERSDLETLYMIYETLKEGCFAMEENTANSREPEEQRLSMQLQSVRAEIVAIRQRKPYRLSALLAREGYVDERNKVLKAEIEALCESDPGLSEPHASLSGRNTKRKNKKSAHRSYRKQTFFSF